MNDSSLLDADHSIEVDGLRFRDLDHDGVLAPYEDWRRPVAERVSDLIGRMTVEEKVGLMLHGTAPAVGTGMASIGMGSEYDLDAIAALGAAGVNSLISRMSLPPALLAEQNNALQRVAAVSRLGIPMTLSTDPRHHFMTIAGASVDANGFSQWPETLGLAAIGDPDVVERFGDIVRQEYRAVGLHVALSPQADLGTEPRWPRFQGTFGEDPALVRSLVGAYVRGIQGGTAGLTSTGVAAVVKHWVGYGASRDGFDGHNYYGRFSAFPGGRFQDHVAAFLDAFSANVAGVMPTYNILEGLTIDGVEVEAVGAGFSRQIVTDLLRGTYGYRGLLLSDWAITKDFSESCRIGVPAQQPPQIAMPWGVEELSRVEKVVKGVLAGIDQFGGENDPAALLEAIRDGLITETRVDESAARILLQKFELGLFENPFVDPSAAAEIVGCDVFRREGETAQRRSVTLLKGSRNVPALSVSSRVHVHGFAPDAFVDAGLLPVSLDDATVAVVRLDAPHQLLHPGHFFGRMQHEGDLDFKDDDPDLIALTSIAAQVPTIVVVNLDRPAVLTNIVDKAEAAYAVYGLSDAAVVDVLLGTASPRGRLPFQLPSSMAAVLAQDCDRSNDLADPLYPLFFSA
jgi:beta-glucosidase